MSIKIKIKIRIKNQYHILQEPHPPWRCPFTIYISTFLPAPTERYFMTLELHVLYHTLMIEMDSCSFFLLIFWLQNIVFKVLGVKKCTVVLRKYISPWKDPAYYMAAWLIVFSTALSHTIHANSSLEHSWLWSLRNVSFENPEGAVTAGAIAPVNFRISFRYP